MTLDILREKGTPLDKQQFTWRELVQAPTSKLDDDAFTRVRIILMNGLEAEALRFSHATARMMNGDFRLPLAQIRRVEQHQQTMVNWLLPADLSPLETTIGFEQVAIEVTASVAQHEPDEYLAQVYRFGLLEDFDHLYRFSALMDRVTGADANNIIQNYSDIMPGRPTVVEHRAPEDNLREPYNATTAHPLTKIHAATITAAVAVLLDKLSERLAFERTGTRLYEALLNKCSNRFKRSEARSWNTFCYSTTRSPDSAVTRECRVPALTWPVSRRWALCRC